MKLFDRPVAKSKTMRLANYTAIFLAVLIALTFTTSAFCIDLGDLNPKDPAKGTIDDAEAAAQRLLAQAQATGNGLLSNAASQLDAVAQSAALVLGSDINKNIGQLNQAEQVALVGLAKLQSSININVSQAYDLRDTTIVDLTQWESNIPFVHRPDFFVQTIKNTAFLPQPGDYHMTIIAYGLGPFNSDSKNVVTATLEGKPIALSEVDQTQSGVAVISIPNAALSGYFGQDSLKVVTLGLSVKLSRRHFLGWHSNQYSFPIHLTLYPNQVATATLHISTPVYSWVDTGSDVLSAPYTTPEKNGCDGNVACRANNGPLDVRVVGPLNGDPIPNGQRISSAVLECNSGSICAFAGCQQISTIDNSTHASATWCTWSHPTQWQLRGHVQEWRQVGTNVTDIPIVIAVDRPVTLPLPADHSLLVLDVKSFTKYVYTMVLPANDTHNLVDATLTGPQNDTLAVSAIPPAQYY